MDQISSSVIGFDDQGMFKLENILEDTNYDKAVKTRIVATIGPACLNKETMLEMIDNGMDISRVSLQHTDLKGNQKMVKFI